jgi:alpha,alpha-trehalase
VTTPRRPSSAGGVELAPHVLREFVLLADGERGAVVGPGGDIAWLCVPRWDSPSVFATLLGGQGVYAVTPDEPYVWGGSYEDVSMIWRHRWTTRSGRVECRDALAFPGDSRRAVLLRRVQAVDMTARITVVLRPRAGYDSLGLRELRRDGDGWRARAGDLHLRWSGARRARPSARGEQLRLVLRLEPGEHHNLVLEVSDEQLPDEPPDPDEAWRTTEQSWRSCVPAFDGLLSRRDVQRSYAVLRALTSNGGGMVAAATTSLPERAAAGRNYDYRYVWIRDQAYAGQAVAAAAGADPLVGAAVGYLTERLLEHGDGLAPAYTPAGEPVPGEHHLDLPGYPGGFDIVGNWVRKQFQLDAFGEALSLFATADALGLLDPRGWRAAEAAAAAIERRWREPDAGIWELRPQRWTHSRLAAAAGLRAIASAAPYGEQAAEWLALADRIVADTAAHAVHPSGRWQRTPDDARVDAALLIPSVRGALASDDPRARATLDAVLAELTVDGYAYRFQHEGRTLTDAEGSFLLCGFLLALALHQRGDDVEARAWFERNSTACGPAQLYSEEYDPAQRQMRGNLPQAFVHALHLESAARLVQPAR